PDRDVVVICVRSYRDVESEIIRLHIVPERGKDRMRKGAIFNDHVVAFAVSERRSSSSVWSVIRNGTPGDIESDSITFPRMVNVGFDSPVNAAAVRAMSS